MGLLQSEGVLIIAILVYIASKIRVNPSIAVSAAVQHESIATQQENNVSVRRGSADGFEHASLPSNHHDLDEYRNTPGFFLVYPNGEVEAGKQ